MKHAWVWLVLAGVALMAFVKKPLFSIDRIALAIAFAEGWYAPGSRAQRNHNPGDLTKSMGFNWIGMDGQFVIFATDADGWGALKALISEMLDNTSSIYNSGMTILEVASHYTATEVEAWASNVASALGVSVDTPLNQIGALI